MCEMGLDSEEYLLSRKIIGIVGCPLGDVKQGRGENMEMSYSYSMSFLKSQDQQKKKIGKTKCCTLLGASAASLIHGFDLQCKFANFKTNPFAARGLARHNSYLFLGQQ